MWNETKNIWTQEIATFEKADHYDDKPLAVETATQSKEDKAKLSRPVKKPLVVGRLEQLDQSQTLVESGQLRTSAVESITEQQIQDALKIQQAHMLRVIKHPTFWDQITLNSTFHYFHIVFLGLHNVGDVG